MPAQVHNLKTWPLEFDAIKSLRKTFEWRLNDRNYTVGDMLVLRKFDPAAKDGKGEYCGEEILVEVTHILDKGFGLPKGYVIMSFRNPVYYASSDKALYIASLKTADLKPTPLAKGKPGPKPKKHFDKPIKNS